MGFYLLHESMLDAVIFARDKFLKDDKLSIMLPSHATIYSAPCSLEHYLIEKVRIRFIELAHVRNISFSLCLPQRKQLLTLLTIVGKFLEKRLWL